VYAPPRYDRGQSGHGRCQFNHLSPMVTGIMNLQWVSLSNDTNLPFECEGMLLSSSLLPKLHPSRSQDYASSFIVGKVSRVFIPIPRKRWGAKSICCHCDILVFRPWWEFFRLLLDSSLDHTRRMRMNRREFLARQTLMLVALGFQLRYGIDERLRTWNVFR
jgi:hypothetical protein